MNELRKAAEMALEALTLINQDLEKHRATLPIGRQSELCKASLALRQALAHEVTPEVTGEVTEEVGACVACGAPKSEWFVDAVNMSQESVDETAKHKHEPAVWVVQYKDRHEFIWGSKPEFRGGTVLAFQPLYMAPPKREWVGLTKDEIEEIANWADNNAAPWYLGYAYAIEQKLKEKNGGTST